MLYLQFYGVDNIKINVKSRTVVELNRYNCVRGFVYVFMNLNGSNCVREIKLFLENRYFCKVLN